MPRGGEMRVAADINGWPALLLMFALGTVAGWQIKWGYWEWRRLLKILHRKVCKWEAGAR
jgi:hypothetical protein